MSLQVWLPLNGDLHNQGTSGLTFSSASSNTTTNASGKIGACYTNNSHSAGGLISNKPILLGSQYSMCCWFKFTDLEASSNLGGGLISQHRYSKNTGFGLTIKYVSSTTGYLSVNTGTGSARTYNTYCGTTLLQANTWYHACGTYDGTDIKIYVNGVLEKTQAYTMSAPEDYLTIFCWSLSGSSGATIHGDYKLNGALNDVRIYDHCLSAAEVREISQGLVLHYKLDSFQGGYGNKNLLARYVVPGQAAPTSTASSGRTIWLGDYKITIPAKENADTYFRLFMTEQLTSGTTYTISCKVSGLLNGSYYRFPLFSQSNTSMGVLNLDHNGLCSLTFTMNWTGTQTAVTGANGETVYVNFLDDSARALASGQGAITLYDFKLEKGSSATTWCPSDASLTQIQDSSGYNHNGTINSSPIISSETMRYGSSIMFDGVDDCIKIPFNDIIKDKNYTVSVWTYKTSIGTKNYQTILGGPSGFELEARSSSSTSPLYRIHNWGGGTTAYEFNKWNLFTFVHTDSNSKLYVNGELKITGTSANIPTGNYYIGAWNSVTGQNYEGLMSDFRIYCAALDADAIRQLYEVGAKIDSRANFHTYEINENGTNKLTKTGVMYDNMEESIMTLPDGSHWQLLMFHYVDNGHNLFTRDNAAYCNDFGLYSRLRDIDGFKLNNQYEFYVIQDDIEYRWTQTNAPATSTSPGTVTTISGYNNPSVGLAKNGSNTYLGYNSWWGACGCWTLWNGNAIPGFGGRNCTKYLALYARIEKADVKLSNQTANTSEFLEL